MALSAETDHTADHTADSASIAHNEQLISELIRYPEFFLLTKLLY